MTSSTGCKGSVELKPQKDLIERRVEQIGFNWFAYLSICVPENPRHPLPSLPISTTGQSITGITII